MRILLSSTTVLVIAYLSLQNAHAFSMIASKWSPSTSSSTGLAAASGTAASTTEKYPTLLLSLAENWGNSESATAKLVLASQSPRRREILDMMMLKEKYTIEPSPVDEEALQADLLRKGLSSLQYTQKLAEAKALAVAELHLEEGRRPKANENDERPTFYLGSDTIVELDGAILEKPKGPEEACQMLAMMSSREHCVHTGVALYRLEGDKISLVSSFTETATVRFTSLSEETIKAYVATGEPLDKAGSYGIQGIGGQLVSNISGDFFTVMGLPMHKTSQLLAAVVSK